MMMHKVSPRSVIIKIYIYIYTRVQTTVDGEHYHTHINHEERSLRQPHES